ncbi:MAG: hypothetical protein R2867_37805 [Caldilineaceae bacterium]
MKRGVITLIIIGLHLLVLTVALRIPVAAKSLQQTVPDATTPAEQTPLQLRVHQQVPLAITVQSSAATTTTAALTETIAVTLDLQFDVTMTNTVTATVPSSITLTFSNQQTTTIPLSLTVTLTPTASVVITPLTSTLPLTATSGANRHNRTNRYHPLTPTIGLTTTVPPQVLSPTVVSSVAITTNLRSGPDTTFDLQTTIGPGTSILVVAQNVDGTWYLLNNGLWVAAFLVNNPPANLPLATEDLVTTLREQINYTHRTDYGSTSNTAAAKSPQQSRSQKRRRLSQADRSLYRNAARRHQPPIPVIQSQQRQRQRRRRRQHHRKLQRRRPLPSKHQVSPLTPICGMDREPPLLPLVARLPDKPSILWLAMKMAVGSYSIMVVGLPLSWWPMPPIRPHCPWPMARQAMMSQPARVSRRRSRLRRRWRQPRPLASRKIFM